MIFAIVVHSPDTAAAALRFAQSAVARGHTIHRVFFYHDAVQTGSSLIVAPQDEPAPRDGWASFAAEHGVELAVCVAAAQRRGVLDDSEARRNEKPAGNLAEPFVLVGLGQLVEAATVADRTITFGAPSG